MRVLFWLVKVSTFSSIIPFVHQPEMIWLQSESSGSSKFNIWKLQLASTLTPEQNIELLQISDLGRVAGVGLVKYRPYLVFWSLPPSHSTLVVSVFKPKLPRDLLLAGLVVVQVESVQGGQGLLGVPVLGVGHPAAGLHLVGVQPPVLQLLLEQRAADISGVVELPCKHVTITVIMIIIITILLTTIITSAILIFILMKGVCVGGNNVKNTSRDRGRWYSFLICSSHLTPIESAQVRWTILRWRYLERRLWVRARLLGEILWTGSSANHQSPSF